MSSTPPPPSEIKEKKTPTQRRPSNTRKESPKAEKKEPTPNQPSPASGHKKQPSRGGGRRASGGAQGSGGAGQKKETATAAPAQTEGLVNLKNLISELKDSPSAPTSTTSGGSPAHSSASHSPSRTRNQHRKTPSGSAAPVPSINAPPASSSAAANPLSTLNPNAGGFHPGTLGPIHDMMDEGLITPTASHFDLMTGMPKSPPGIGGFRQSLGGQDGTAPFAFPQAQQQQQQQQMFQLQQQQQFQMQQMAAAAAGLSGGAGGFGGAAAHGGAGSTDAAELMAEQLAIQQQLANLRIQQENLLARFGDMQASASNAAPQPSSSPQERQQHRRVQSAAQHQPMGSFGQGGMGNFVAPPPSTAGSLPKGHGRRHSVNVGGQQKTGGFGGAGGSFSFGAGSQSQANSSEAPPASRGAFQFPPPSNSTGMGHGSMDSYGGQSEFGQGDDGGFGGGSGNRRGMGHQRRQSGSMSSIGGWQQMNQGVQANLAEAQSHLQQLAAYRASSGHSRVPSFGMSTLGGGPGQLAMAGYGGGLPQPGQGGNQQQRKSLFAPYLPQASIPPLLSAGKLVIGVLRVNKRNRSDAYVATDVLDADIYICGSKDRNRALEGDIVAVELLDVDEVWGTKKDKEEKKRKKEESASYDPRATRDLRKQDKKKDDVEVEGQGLLLFEEEEVNDDQKPQFAGHVVAVVERAPGQLFSGMLGVLRPSSAATQQKQDAERREREGVDLRNDHHHRNQPIPKIIWFRPTDKRVPLIAIPTEQAPQDFIDRPDKYQDRLFVSCIKRWPITSLHPFGTLVEELGPIGDIETETNALLKDCNFSAEDFSEAVVKCLPPTPWAIPERETQEAVRRDFRSNRVFTIDPETARDLDDALHVVRNEDGTFEVGVHIADVTHFVKPNTALDREARKRATTVYLVQRAVPMLPESLSNTLCSLTAGEDKLTFSVVFTMSPEGKVLSTWFGKSIINSAVKLAYSDAQEVIEGRPLPDNKIEGDHSQRAGVEGDIKKLASLARHLRKRRFDNGALRIDNVKVTFKLDEDGLPDDASTFVRKEANELIEEFMLLANISVAGKIAAGLPDQALLRRHEPPIDRRLDAFLDRMKRLDIDLDGSSAGALMQSFGDVTDPNARFTLQHLSTKSMQRAKYFCTGMLDIAKYHHYALNLPLYTHFTSPIRRYADIMVHRQLEAVLANSNDVKFTLDTEAVSKVAQTCNMKKDAARLAQEQSAHLFLCVLIADLTQRYGPVVRPATVIGVLDQAFDVMIPEFGIEKRVHVDQMPTENTVHDEDTNALSIYWKKGVDVLRWLADTNNDAHLQRVRHHAEHHARMMESRSGQADAESALFDDDDDDDQEAAKKKPVKMTAQHLKSRDTTPLTFEDIHTKEGHSIQTVRELQTVPVIVTADMTKSPPVIKVLAVNPYA